MSTRSDTIRPHVIWPAVLASALIGALAMAAPAVAEPTVAELEADIDTVATELETTIENHHAIVADLDELTERHATLANTLRPMTSDGDQAIAEVNDLAAALYRHGPNTLITPLTATGPSDLADRLTMLEFITARHRDQVAAATTALVELDAAQRDIDDLTEQRDALADERDTLKDRIEEATTELDAARAHAAGFGYFGPSGRPAPPIPAGLDGAATTAINFAHSVLGAPYQWGGTGPGYDCSGLTSAAWSAAGVSLPHSSAGQYDVTAHIARDELQPGDLVFYYTDLHHVALYVGDGSVIHAPTAGQNVQVAPVDLAPVAGYGRVL
ncbi:NlpC/P60 family protein [Stackebrandtia soli]|uniref:C40 family peptidase n=1 Tax=Stackebrandtia soli TaxID=1892856 RepID=UPI0039ED2DBC